MPKEHLGHFGERVGRNTSKNAKDKSNSATVRADRVHHGQAGAGTLGGAGDVGERLSRFDSGKDSEKDSGYSEAGSDSVQNDPDDRRSSSTSQGHRKNGRSTVAVGNQGGSGFGTAAHDGGRLEDLSSVYVVKNLVVKPSRQEQLLHRPLTWAGGWHSLSGPRGPTQLLLIQQPALTAPSSSSSSTLATTSAPADTQSQPNKKGCSSRSSGKNHYHHSASKNSYLPILNSYPRIAPHPRKEGHTQGKSSSTPSTCKENGGGGGGGGGGGVGGEGQSQSKRVCTEEELKRETVSTTTRNLSSHHHHHHHNGRHRDFHHKVRRSSETHANPPPVGHTKSYRRSHHSSDAVGSPSVSSTQMPSLPSHSSSSSSTSSQSPSSSSSSSSSCPTSYSSSSVAHSPYRPRQGRARAVAAAASGHLSDAPSECSSVRQRRFLNTAEILSQSGLLAITLRTKELQKQSDTTEREIAQLRQHTQLLCQAALAGRQVPNDGSNGLQRLLQAMAQSGSYPGLDSGAQAKAIGDNRKQSEKRGEARQADSQGRVKNGLQQQQQLVSLQGVDEVPSPPSPLFAPSPEAERMERVNSLAGSLSMDNDLTDLAMSPKSSTFDNYLF